MHLAGASFFSMAIDRAALPPGRGIGLGDHAPVGCAIAGTRVRRSEPVADPVQAGGPSYQAVGWPAAFAYLQPFFLMTSVQVRRGRAEEEFAL
jgi:hypothetical protein